MYFVLFGNKTTTTVTTNTTSTTTTTKGQIMQTFDARPVSDDYETP